MTTSEPEPPDQRRPPAAIDTTAFSLPTRRVNGRDVVALTGELELDLATASGLAPVIEELLARGRTRITVDLAGVTFMDAYALRQLVIAGQAVAAVGGLLDVTCNARYERLLSLTGATELA